MPELCGSCNLPATLKCSRCKKVFYCNVKCQKMHWKQHKPDCKKMNQQNKDTDNHETLASEFEKKVYFGLASAWADRLRKKDMYEWLVNCYRMRIDDVYIYQEKKNGLYNKNATKFSIVTDFWMFCRLAVEQEVIIERLRWNWKIFLDIARRLLSKPFMKSDAIEKYGTENIFSVQMGNRSLRNTAAAVYNCNILPCGVSGNNRGGLNIISKSVTPNDLFSKKIGDFIENLTDAKEFWKVINFEKVGGMNLWFEFHENFKLTSFKLLPPDERTFSLNTCILTPSN